METSENLGIAVLLMGVALLTTTFIDSYLFLRANVSILPVPNLVAAFGEALAPLIEACIRMLYLGVMGWIGSIITLRGITVLLHVIPETKLKTPKKKAKVDAEPKDLEEAWETALQEAKLEVKSA
jgi:hypothetical protein